MALHICDRDGFEYNPTAINASKQNSSLFMYVIYYTTIVNLPTRAVARSLNTQIEYGSNNKVYSK